MRYYYQELERIAREAREQAARDLQNFRDKNKVVYQSAKEAVKMAENEEVVKVAVKSLLKTKTFWAGLAGVLAAVGGYATGEMTLGVAINTGITGLIGIFLRSGMLR